MADQQMPRSFIPDDPALPSSFQADKKDDTAKRSTAADLGIGAAKGIGRSALDLASLLGKINPIDAMANLVLPESVSRNMPGQMLDRMRASRGDVFDATNTAQTVGGVASDVLMAAVPGGAAARGGNTLRNMAARQWQSAARRPVREPLSVARGVLDEGLGRLSRSNAIEYARRHPNLSPTALRTIDRSVEGAEQAANNTGRSLIGMVTSPGARATAAQGLYSAAPALNATAGGMGGLALQALVRMLGGGQ